MNDEMMRNVAADQMACAFLVEIMLVDYLRKFPETHRGEIAETLQRAARKTDHFEGRAKTDEIAEVLADVTVRMYSALDGYLERALARVGMTPG